MKVYVGISGGVDSSVTAKLLVEAGYEVTGVYMKNWSADLPGHYCPWKEDYQDAKRVAVQLGIDLKLYDFESDYKHLVVDYMLEEFQAGRTPNPDIMCNQEIKFKLFLKAAMADGADMIATGHYAKTKDGQLYRAVDDNKDQTYFLYRVTEEALLHTLFPLGQFTKPQVRELASNFGLVTATKKESMGICFVGKVGIKEFLSQYITTTPGPIIEQNGVTIGKHEGAIFYTIGQRHGLNIGGGLPYYVAGKDMATNTVYVTTDLNDPQLWRANFSITDCHWISKIPDINKTYQVRTRHRQNLIGCQIDLNQSQANILLDEPLRALTPGQSAVLYDGEIVLGGGIII